MKKITQKNKYIILKDGYNKPLCIGFVFAFIVCVVLFTSKLWLPDTRPNMMYAPEEELVFNYSRVLTPKTVFYDKNNNIMEFMLPSEITNESNLTYKAYLDDATQELPNEVIYGLKTKQADSEVYYNQNILMQIRVPNDFYYITVEISQKNNVKQTFTIDYRNIKLKTNQEKGKDYLKSLEKSKNEIIALKASEKEKNELIEKNNEQIALIDKQLGDKKIKKDQISKLSKTRNDLSNDNENINKILNTLSTQIDTLEKEVRTLQSL